MKGGRRHLTKDFVSVCFKWHLLKMIVAEVTLISPAVWRLVITWIILNKWDRVSQEANPFFWQTSLLNKCWEETPLCCRNYEKHEYIMSADWGLCETWLIEKSSGVSCSQQQKKNHINILLQILSFLVIAQKCVDLSPGDFYILET